MHQFALIVLDVELYLLFMVLSAHFFVDQEDLVQEKMHILVHVDSLFMSHLIASFFQLLNACVHNPQFFVLAMALDYVFDSFGCIDS